MIVHFSCGAASAVSALLCLEDNPELVYTDPGLEHKDNHRFLVDFSKLINRPITILKNKEFKTPFDVFKKRRFLAGPAGAPCTTELKKKTAQEYLQHRLYEEVNVFGFDIDEQKRLEKYKKNNPLMKVRAPLIENGLSKSDCFYIIDSLGLNLPYMYKLGYKNANCTGCVKAESIGYWAAIREDFPNVFKWYADFERKIGAIDEITGEPKGAAINKRYEGDERIRVFLDEIPEDFPAKRNISFTCGYSCGAQDMEIEAVEELTKEPSLIGYIALQKIKKVLNSAI